MGEFFGDARWGRYFVVSICLYCNMGTDGVDIMFF